VGFAATALAVVGAVIRDWAMTLELWRVGGSKPGTVLRRATKEAFVSGIATCL